MHGGENSRLLCVCVFLVTEEGVFGPDRREGASKANIIVKSHDVDCGNNLHKLGKAGGWRRFFLCPLFWGLESRDLDREGACEMGWCVRIQLHACLAWCSLKARRKQDSKRMCVSACPTSHMPEGPLTCFIRSLVPHLSQTHTIGLISSTTPHRQWPPQQRSQPPERAAPRPRPIRYPPKPALLPHPSLPCTTRSSSAWTRRSATSNNSRRSVGSRPRPRHRPRSDAAPRPRLVPPNQRQGHPHHRRRRPRPAWRHPPHPPPRWRASTTSRSRGGAPGLAFCC